MFLLAARVYHHFKQVLTVMLLVTVLKLFGMAVALQEVARVWLL